MKEDGTDAYKKLYANRIMKNPYYVMDVYNTIIDYFKKIGYKENKLFFPFFYDWRKDISKYAAKELGKIIDQVKKKTKSSKVILIAHSMGGVVANQYFAENNNNLQNISKIFYAGSPVFGAPKMLAVMRFGLESPIGFSFFVGPSRETIRETVRNMQGVYQLLPTSDYKRDFYEEDGVIDDRNAFDELNSEMVENAKKFYANIKKKLFVKQKDGTFQFKFKEKAYFILGDNRDTINKIIVKDGKYSKIIKQKIGDGTVPMYGLDKLVQKEHRKIITGKNSEHTKLVQNDETFEFILEKINGN